MRSFYLASRDVAIILLATFAAILLRDNFDLLTLRLAGLMPYVGFTALVAMIAIPVFGINRAIWRFSAMPDYLRIMSAMLVIIVGAVMLTFAFNRLETVPRSLPFIQFNMAVLLLIGARVLYRLQYSAWQARRQGMAPLKIVEEPAQETILLVGLSRLTETFLQSMRELAAPGQMKVAGILGHHERHVGRLVAAHRVLGLPEDIARVLSELAVSGVNVDRIVITAPAATLPRKAQEAISAIKKGGQIKVQYLSADLGFDPVACEQAERGIMAVSAPLKFEIETGDLYAMRRRPYWRVKRAIDIAASLLLLTALTPVFILVGVLVAASIGWPLVFWQQRPGLGGRPFQLYKFRSFGAPLAADGRILSDAERASGVGNFLRRTRLDELPQFFNILRGDMSFIGPRPLLPRDQDDACRARLLVRPGLTGWAQVIGGRGIAAEDKAALDVWYVRNASILLDVQIIARTIPMVVLGERTCESLIDHAWRDLHEAGVLKGSFPSAARVAAAA